MGLELSWDYFSLDELILAKSWGGKGKEAARSLAKSPREGGHTGMACSAEDPAPVTLEGSHTGAKDQLVFSKKQPPLK